MDAYIAKAASFAQPILEALRDTVHASCPGVEEQIKWGMPSFVFGDGILCSMAAFKQHVTFGYWKHALVMGEGAERDGMGSYGRMHAPKDLPTKARLRADLKKAIALNVEGTKVAKVARPRPAASVPEDLAAALARNAAARKTFEAFPPGQRREYIEWIVEAKRADTRARRLLQAIEWLAEGKRRNWKYENC